jgi:hypothetical protein
MKPEADSKVRVRERRAIVGAETCFPKHVKDDSRSHITPHTHLPPVNIITAAAVEQPGQFRRT